MKKIIQKCLFEGKDSLYSNRLAFSTPQTDYTYQELSEKIDSTCKFFRSRFQNEHKKVMVSMIAFDDLLIASLGLLKAGCELQLVSSESVPKSFQNMIDKEQPDFVLVSSGITANHADIMEWDSETISNTVNSAKDAPKVSMPNTKFTYILEDGGTAIIEESTIKQAYIEIEKTMEIGSNATERYFIAGSLDQKSVLLETMALMYNGIHVLYYPEINDAIKELRPTEAQFPMDFSLFFFGNSKDNSEDMDTYSLLMDSVAHGDKYGYTAVWTPERHFNEFGGRFPNPSVLSAAIAAKTSRIQIRTGSIVAPLHHVVRMAEDWSIIDNLSGGRTALSFASGWQCNDFIFYPKNYDHRHEIMMSRITDLRKLWSGEKMEFENGVGDKIEVGIFPRPVQAEIPIWITVSGKTETFVDAGKVGANILTHLLWQDPSDLKEKIQAYRDSLKEHGFDPDSKTVSVMLHTFVGEDKDEVKKIVEQPLKNYIKSSVHLVETMTSAVKKTEGKNSIGRYGKTDGVMPDHLKEELLDIAFERFFSSASLLGDQEHCSEVLKKLRSYGVDELACLIDFGLDDKTILEGLNGLNKLKQSFSMKGTKRYTGSFMLKTNQEGLETIHKLDDQLISSYKKVAVTLANENEDRLAFRHQVNMNFNWDSKNVISCNADTTFASKEAAIHRKNLEQANELISENF